MLNIKTFTEAVESLNDKELETLKKSLDSIISDKSFEKTASKTIEKVIEFCELLQLTEEASNVLIYLVLFDLSENLSEKIRYEHLLYMLIEKFEEYVIQHEDNIIVSD